MAEDQFCKRPQLPLQSTCHIIRTSGKHPVLIFGHGMPRWPALAKSQTLKVRSTGPFSIPKTTRDFWHFGYMQCEARITGRKNSHDWIFDSLSGACHCAQAPVIIYVIAPDQHGVSEGNLNIGLSADSWVSTRRLFMASRRLIHHILVGICCQKLGAIRKHVDTKMSVF